MKTVDRKRVMRMLRNLGLRPRTRGNGTGPEIWENSSGRRCHPRLIRKELSLATVYALGESLESQGICNRQAFMQRVMGKS